MNAESQNAQGVRLLSSDGWQELAFTPRAAFEYEGNQFISGELTLNSQFWDRKVMLVDGSENCPLALDAAVRFPQIIIPKARCESLKKCIRSWLEEGLEFELTLTETQPLVEVRLVNSSPTSASRKPAFSVAVVSHRHQARWNLVVDWTCINLFSEALAKLFGLRS